MKRAIVTGASGFVGKALVKKLLSHGYFVFAVVRDPAKMKDVANDRLSVVQCQLSELKNLDEKIPCGKIDAFFHMAWDGTFGESFKDFHRQFESAAYVGDAVVAASKLGAERFLFAGTIVEIETRHYILNDGGEPRISCIYGAAKTAANILGRVMACQCGVKYNEAVLASAFGEGDFTGTIQNILISALLKNTVPPLADGKNLYDWVYIDDVTEALVAITEKGKPGKTYYVGHRELQTFEWLVTQTRNIVAPNVKLDFGTLKAKTVLDYSLIDREELFRDTGFECKADFCDSVRKTAEWIKQKGETDMTNIALNRARGGVKRFNFSLAFGLWRENALTEVRLCA